jgi:gamma-glutamyl:cysteine ligase YbdK (ATP-grasp superfamily)
MGSNISQIDFCQADFNKFQDKLFEQLELLKTLLKQPEFGQDTLKLGAELEMYLVDNSGNVSPNNLKVLQQLDDKQFQPELNKYNIELNLSAVAIAGKPFSALVNEIREKTQKLEQIARLQHTNIVPIGILPTLKKYHLDSDNMTDLPRYHCLSKHLYQQRGENFKVNINGKKPLSVDFNDICAEGANTSFQVHLMTKPEKLKDIFNSAQLTLPFVTAIAGNSGIFLGQPLWDETRIALFKQSLDFRLRDEVQWQQPTRVNFGHGWLRDNIWEFFAEAVALYPPLIPFCQTAESKPLPSLHELSMHLGTIWPWHRPVYSAEGNGHVRIEFRAIPAGPTSVDMVANAAFAIGLAVGMSENINESLSLMPFRFAEYNFYRAAQYGLDAKILWPTDNKYQPKEIEITKAMATMLPIAKAGLHSLNIDNEEVNYFIGIIEQRLASKVTGAVWQKETLNAFEKNMTTDKACEKLVQVYLENCRSCQPVATWERLWK